MHCPVKSSDYWPWLIQKGLLFISPVNSGQAWPAQTEFAPLIWTNRSEMRSQSPSRPYLRIHTAYDAVMTSGVVWVCYNERGAIWIERIHPVPSTGQRQRQFLVGSGSEVLPMDAWTNGVFNSVSEQAFELHLQGDRGSKLIWRLDGNLWRLNRQASAPEPISRHAAASSYSYEYVGGRWDKRMLVSCLPPNDDSSAPDD